MYYWHQYSNKTTLDKEILSVNGVKEVFIGTAFFREVIKKNCINKSKVHIYISDEFSQDKPHELLAKICEIAQVRIFFNNTFHSKVYFF